MPPVTFQLVEEADLLRHGSKALAAQLPKPETLAGPKRISDDRWLSARTRRVFQAGLEHALVDAKCSFCQLSQILAMSVDREPPADPPLHRCGAAV